MPNAGYYFMQNACEPVHIQLNLMNNKITVVNRTYKPKSDLTAQVDVFGLDSKSVFHEAAKVSLGATDVKETTSVANVLAESKGVVFVILNLKDGMGKTISHNAYWLSKDNDYKTMNTMAETAVSVNVLKEENGKHDRKWVLQVTNSSDKIAFFIRPQVMAGGEEILPSFWSESYFTLAPTETTTITVTCPLVKLIGRTPVLKVSGWNVTAKEISLKKN
jgi:hypothetical protein